MPDYAALLRGVSPLNATMAGLKKAFEKAGFDDVRTVLGSGNVVFRTTSRSLPAIEARAEVFLRKHLGRTFMTIVRRIDALQTLLASEPYRGISLKPGSKRIVTFLRRAAPKTALPPGRDGARICAVRGLEVFSAYIATSKGPVFMALLEKTFGKNITTRTWDTVVKIVRA
jgi:uncharacterized protein (DUF1697 family)